MTEDIVRHSPGPWVVVEHSWSDTSIFSSRNHVALLSIANQATEENQDELECGMAANARLIAAAPELLAALKACAAVCAGETLNKRSIVFALEQARAAIIKAEGAQP